MPKAYWMVFYRSISDPAAFSEYAKLAGPAIQAGGGKFLVRGVPQLAFEAGLKERVVVIEFDSVERALGVYESEAYRAAKKVLGKGAERDIRIVEGV